MLSKTIGKEKLRRRRNKGKGERGRWTVDVKKVTNYARDKERTSSAWIAYKSFQLVVGGGARTRRNSAEDRFCRSLGWQ